MSSARTVSYTASDLRLLLEKGGSRTDWAKVDAITDADLAAMITADADEGPPAAGASVQVVTPVVLGLPASLSRELPTAAADRNREVSRIVANYLKRRAARSRRAG